MNPPILLIGKTGQIGTDILPMLLPLGEVTALDHAQLDLARPADVRRAIRDARPRLIVNAAAHTAVDQAEDDEATARAVNADAPGIMAEEAKKIGAALVHYSTDYVFDGSKRSPYLETDPPHPLNVYGRTKLAGEQAIQAAGAPYLIFRTAWVYATRGKNFVLAILKQATEREELRVVSDQTGSPAWSREIAAATVRVLERLASGSNLGNLPRQGTALAVPKKRADSGVLTPEAFEGVSGLYHMTAAGETHRADFARAILEEARNSLANNLRQGTASAVPKVPVSSGVLTPGAKMLVQPASPLPAWLAAATGEKPIIAQRVVPITSADAPTRAPRPAYSVLSNALFERTFGFALPSWRVQLHSAFTNA